MPFLSAFLEITFLLPPNINEQHHQIMVSILSNRCCILGSGRKENTDHGIDHAARAFNRSGFLIAHNCKP